MSNSIYNSPAWASLTNYNQNDIIVNSNLYYYANLAHLSSSSFSTDLANNRWGGQITDRNEQKKYFIWKPAYNYNVDNKPRIKKISLGDGYTSRMADGISNILPSINLTFESDLSEATSILHFLENCGGSESFVWLPPSPFGVLSRWVCEEWSSTERFYNNYTINAKFDRTTI